MPTCGLLKALPESAKSRPLSPQSFYTKGLPRSPYLVHLEGSHQQVVGSLGSSWVELEKKRECIQIMLRELPTRSADVCFLGSESKARPLQKGLVPPSPPVHTSMLGLKVGQAHPKATGGCNTTSQLAARFLDICFPRPGFCLHRQECKVAGVWSAL